DGATLGRSVPHRGADRDRGRHRRGARRGAQMAEGLDLVRDRWRGREPRRAPPAHATAIAEKFAGREDDLAAPRGSPTVQAAGPRRRSLGGAARRAPYCFSLTSTPLPASVSWAPVPVPVSFITTPCWFFMTMAPAPPPRLALACADT